MSRKTLHQAFMGRVVYPNNVYNWRETMRKLGVLVGKVIAVREADSLLILTIETGKGQVFDHVNAEGCCLAEEGSSLYPGAEDRYLAGGVMLEDSEGRMTNRRTITWDPKASGTSIVMVGEGAAARPARVSA